MSFEVEGEMMMDFTIKVIAAARWQYSIPKSVHICEMNIHWEPAPQTHVLVCT